MAVDNERQFLKDIADDAKSLRRDLMSDGGFDNDYASQACMAYIHGRLFPVTTLEPEDDTDD